MFYYANPNQRDRPLLEYSGHLPSAQVYRGTRDWHPQGSAGLSPVLLAGFACGSWRVVPGLPGFQPQAHALVVSLQWPALANPCFNAPIPCSRKELYRETFLLISVLLQFLSLFSLFASPRRYNYCLSDRLLGQK